MEQTESDIKRVLQDYQKIGSGARCEEARIEVLNREIKVLEDRVRGSGSVELERHRMRNLLDYQSTLIARAASRTELLAALHEDLLLLFIRRKQLRGFGMGLLKSVWLLKNFVNSEEKKRNGKAVYFLSIMSWVRKSEQFKHSTKLSQDICIRVGFGFLFLVFQTTINFRFKILFFGYDSQQPNGAVLNCGVYFLCYAFILLCFVAWPHSFSYSLCLSILNA